MPGVIMMGSMFILFCIEMWLNSKTGGHSHGGATGERVIPSGHAHGITANYAISTPIPQKQYSEPSDWPVDEKRQLPKEYVDQMHEDTSVANHCIVCRYGPQLDGEPEPPSEMPAWFIVFYEQYVRQRDEMLGMISKISPSLPSYATSTEKSGAVVETSYFDDEENQFVDPLVLQRMSLNITLLEGGILFHSVFVGMTVSITTDGFIVLLIAILFHQMFEGLGLGSRIAEVPYPKGTIRPWLLVVAFGTTAPIGQAIGLITRNSYDPNSAFGLIIVGTFNAISSGLLIYAALVDLLQEDFLSEEANKTLTTKKKITGFIYVLMGAAGMSIVGAFA
jgi:solute carrier family 39 (zinc transporter), member 1/2/3